MTYRALVWLAAPLACVTAPGSIGNYGGGETGNEMGSTTGSGPAMTTGDVVTGDEGDAGTTEGGPILDVQPPDTPPEGDACAATDLDALIEGDTPPCTDVAPPESFDPVQEWSYPAAGDPSLESQVTPLVINFTDDNLDGEIDLCDTPDVILTANRGGSCQIHVIDGDYGNSGTVHAVIDEFDLSCDATPAVGDIDGDGEPEIVAVTTNEAQTIIAIDNDGSLLWESDPNPHPPPLGIWTEGQVGLYDVNADGTFEIVVRHALYDATGTLLWAMPELEDAPDGFPLPMYSELIIPTAVDLDDDGDLELLTAYAAHDFDDDWNETLLWDLYADGVLPVFSMAHVADLDDDPQPEVLYVSDDGYLVVEHDGTLKWPLPVKPDLDPLCEDFVWNGYLRPAAIDDYDNDGQAEFAHAACDTFAIYDVTPDGPEVMMQREVLDYTGASSSTAFDFLGDATPEAVYSDEYHAWAWSFTDGDWDLRLQLPRRSYTLVEFPSVADVDNDGSAEILVASRFEEPALVVFGDSEDRWIQARRIFNQHAYWVTHVNEDGTVPAATLPNWEYLNNFRVNSQIEDGSLCDPAG